MNNGIDLKFPLEFIAREFRRADKFTVARPSVCSLAARAFYSLIPLPFVKDRAAHVNKIAVGLKQNDAASFFAPDVSFAVNVFDWFFHSFNLPRRAVCRTRFPNRIFLTAFLPPTSDRT